MRTRMSGGGGWGCLGYTQPVTETQLGHLSYETSSDLNRVINIAESFHNVLFSLDLPLDVFDSRIYGLARLFQHTLECASVADPIVVQVSKETINFNLKAVLAAPKSHGLVCHTLLFAKGFEVISAIVADTQHVQ